MTSLFKRSSFKEATKSAMQFILSRRRRVIQIVPFEHVGENRREIKVEDVTADLEELSQIQSLIESIASEGQDIQGFDVMLAEQTLLKVISSAIEQKALDGSYADTAKAIRYFKDNPEKLAALICKYNLGVMGYGYYPLSGKSWMSDSIFEFRGRQDIHSRRISLADAQKIDSDVYLKAGWKSVNDEISNIYKILGPPPLRARLGACDDR